MTRCIAEDYYQEHYEYHGNTTIEWIRKKGKKTIFRNWIIFDSVEEAQEYFNSDCVI